MERTMIEWSVKNLPPESRLYYYEFKERVKCKSSLNWKLEQCKISGC